MDKFKRADEMCERVSRDWDVEEIAFLITGLAMTAAHLNQMTVREFLAWLTEEQESEERAMGHDVTVPPPPRGTPA